MSSYTDKTILVAILSGCILLSGCGQNPVESGAEEKGRSNIAYAIDYTEWYRDINNTDIYNYVTCIELDIWFTEDISSFNWDGITYDVSYEEQIVATDLSPAFGQNYIGCVFDSSNDNAILSNGYLATGTYEILMKDDQNNVIVASACQVTAESGEMLSTMIIDIEKLTEQVDPLSLRIGFDGDITPYTQQGFYITISQDDGATSYMPSRSNYDIELADTYLIINYFNHRDSDGKFLLSLYCGDGTFVCSEKVGL